MMKKSTNQKKSLSKKLGPVELSTHTIKQISVASQLIDNAKNIVAFTGAGISTESGLSDFRSPGGLWDRYRIITHPEFLSSKEARNEYWAMRRELIPMILAAKPNPGHKAIARLEEEGKLSAVITQNIDGLHQEAGSKNVIEVHGTNRTASCLSCAKQWKIEEIQLRLESGDLDPHCDVCDGLIDPDTVSFGQSMPEGAMNQAYTVARTCDLMLMIGSSLEVQPAASIPFIAHQNGARLIFLNKTKTQYDDIAELLVRSGIGDFMQHVSKSY
jgi:NAD-dependent deacetylase